MRYIDADKLLEELRESCKRHAENGREFSLLQRSIRIVHEQPTVDAEPVRHGKNIATDYDEVDQFVCSECGIELQDWRRVERDDYDGEETFHEYRLRYCPHCGARMDKDE